MQLFYLASFLFGLVLGVYAMIRGVERVGSGRGASELDALGRPVGAQRMALSAPVLGAFAMILGVTGYLLLRYTSVSTAGHLGIGIVLASTAAFLAAWMVKRWATHAAEHDVVDERYLLQGHPAQVVVAMSADRAGEIAYEVGGKQYATSAYSLDGAPLDVGTDVVIDRLENGVAYVEAWVQVEQRL